ncbi:hypothetical protein DOTSEDRAFT_46265 [Dothistroma septosporum NZE10]|uniref:Uncharacterized protein n=1 Tax=Dothistroma septosporum (strain NZE10 / CBS 128990) TaxID=675120 RepID=N1PFU7_DOTSN|nr:hypothetical protein DOTSEDRAFT_46265 [Dothistroma septosporum NZE10]
MLNCEHYASACCLFVPRDPRLCMYTTHQCVGECSDHDAQMVFLPQPDDNALRHDAFKKITGHCLLALANESAQSLSWPDPSEETPLQSLLGANRRGLVDPLTRSAIRTATIRLSAVQYSILILTKTPFRPARRSH